MNLMKKVRKNSTKIMAIFIAIIFIGFVGQAYFRSGRNRTNQRKTIAYIADNREITNFDLALARQELEILRLLQADKILRNINVPVFRGIDMQAVMLAELLFSDRTTSPAIIIYIRQMIGANQYRISEKQIYDIYKRSMPNEIYWLLLKNEAQLAGVKTSNEMSGIQLARIIPQLFNGVTYSQIIGSIINQHSVTEEVILKAFSELTAVLTYAKMICASENVTIPQIMHNASWEEETIDVEFVKFDSAMFAKTQSEPSEKELIEHFNKYKKFYAGDINDQNPYGFGYMLDNRVQLEYIAVKLDDVSSTITAPTEEEAEEFYQKNKEEFATLVPSNPKDPNSPKITRIKSYGEVASVILKSLLQSKIDSEAEKILQNARTLTEAGLQTEDMETGEISSEQFKQMAGDYEAAAKQISEKYKIKVYTGRTGLLTASEILADEYLGALFLKGYGYNPLLITRALFAIDELADSELGPFDIPKPHLYENIGPARDILGQIMVIVRVIKAEKASEPNSINQTFAKNTFRLDEDKEQSDANIYSMKEIVAADLKKLSAMDTAKNKAEEFIKLAKKSGWANAVDKFNKRYGQQNTQSREDANAFELQSFTNLQRASSMALETMVMHSAGNPARRQLVNKTKSENLLIYKFYSLIPQDSNTIDTLPMVIEFKPDMSYYCLKNLSVKRLDQDQYERIKALQDYKEDFIQSQSLAPVHFNPENIIKRTNFRLAEEDKEQANIYEPSEFQGDL